MDMTLKEFYESVGWFPIYLVLTYLVGFIATRRFVRANVDKEDWGGWIGADCPPLPLAAFVMLFASPIWLPIVLFVCLPLYLTLASLWKLLSKP